MLTWDHTKISSLLWSLKIYDIIMLPPKSVCGTKKIELWHCRYPDARKVGLFKVNLLVLIVVFQNYCHVIF